MSVNTLHKGDDDDDDDGNNNNNDNNNINTVEYRTVFSIVKFNGFFDEPPVVERLKHKQNEAKHSLPIFLAE
jgi:hypothetical protein